MGVSIFSPPPAGANDAERERAVIETGVLDAKGDPALLAICMEACQLVSGTASLLSVLYGETQYVIAAHGFTMGAYGRKHSLSGHALAAGSDLFVVPDLSMDERFSENPWVNGEVARFRYYVASLIRPWNRYPVAAISVLDTAARVSITSFEQQTMLAAAEKAAARIMQISREGLSHKPTAPLDSRAVSQVIPAYPVVRT